MNNTWWDRNDWWVVMIGFFSIVLAPLVVFTLIFSSPVPEPWLTFGALWALAWMSLFLLLLVGVLAMAMGLYNPGERDRRRHGDRP